MSHQAIRVLVPIFWTLAISACGRESATPTVAIESMARDSAGIQVITLSHSLSEIGRGAAQAIVLETDLKVGGAEDGFGAVADVTSLGQGRFAVFDRMYKEIILFDTLGHEVRRFGREGKGPGEFMAPWAVAAVGARLVAWQDQPSTAITVFEPGGQVRATSRAAIAGDWERPRNRWPLVNVFGPRDQHGPEDVTRRLVPLGDSGFVHMLQFNENDALDVKSPKSYPAPQAYLIRYDLEAVVRDTLAALTGAQTLVETVIPGRSVLYVQPLYTARPVWTTGAGWLALGHGDSLTMVVRRMSGDTISIIRFSPVRTEVEWDDRIEGAKWINALNALVSAGSREILRRSSARELQRGIERDAAEHFTYARLTPTVTAAYGVGMCLFLGGFSARDWPDGTALTWIALNVASGSLESVFRIPSPTGIPVPLDRRGAAVRAFDRSFVYVTYRDGDGVPFVERFRLPQLHCLGEPGATNQPDQGALP